MSRSRCPRASRPSPRWRSACPTCARSRARARSRSCCRRCDSSWCPGCSRRWRASACRAARTSTRPPTAPTPHARARARSSPSWTRSSWRSRATPTPAGLPILGICRGCQTLNVARGGSLVQHLPAVADGRSTTARPSRAGPSRTTSRSRPARCSRASSAPRRCASTRSTTRPSSGSATACARSRGRPTGRSRASRATSDRFVLGVQWHAETLDEVERPQARLFGALVDAARDRAGALV